MRWGDVSKFQTSQNLCQYWLCFYVRGRIVPNVHAVYPLLKRAQETARHWNKCAGTGQADEVASGLEFQFEQPAAVDNVASVQSVKNICR